MRRLVLPIALIALLAAAAPVASGPAPKRERPQVVDLTAAAPAHDEHAHERPREGVTDAELADVERKIRASTSRDAAAPDDGISDGAPSDEEVRRAIRDMYSGSGERAPGPVRRGSGDLIYPINGQFTSPFGMRWGRLHAGIDLAAPTGTPIRAAASGRVILMAPTGGYGLYTCIDHGKSISTCYAHQSRFGTERGAYVKQAEVMGYVGNTGHSFGAHLHFEIRVNGRPVDPMDYL